MPRTKTCQKNAGEIVFPLDQDSTLKNRPRTGGYACFERVRREGFQSIIAGRDAQIAGLNMQMAVAQERLRLANDLQQYASTRFADAEKETMKLKQQLEEKASPEALALTANVAAAMLSSANVALYGAMKAYEKADEAKLTTTAPSGREP
jgi:hypothetical protein